MEILKKLLLLFGSFALLVGSVIAEPVQFCKFGSKEASGSEIDFCAGFTMHQNASSSAHDLYLTFTVTRPGGSALGWTAIGAGSRMHGALMFIVYGNPSGSEEPVVSIRTTTNHNEPRPITDSDAGGADIRVLNSSWVKPTDGLTPHNANYVATISLVCYSCHLWPGTVISASSNSQPWIWAWNSNQKFPAYSYDAHLEMHKPQRVAGMGKFYVDMSRSVETSPFVPSIPPIRPNVAEFGASESPRTSNPTASTYTVTAILVARRLHPILMGTAFLLLFPAGIIAMRSGSRKAFSYHWVTQLVASACVGLGAIAGILMSRRIDTLHQIVGITVASSLTLQALFGWRHHIIFLKIRSRTWISHAHIWLGRSIMLAGWSNLVLGMVLRGWSVSYIAVLIAVVCVEMMGLILWVGRATARSKKQLKSQQTQTAWPPWAANRDENYSAITDEDDDNDDAHNDVEMNDQKAKNNSLRRKANRHV